MFRMAIHVRISQICFVWLYMLALVRYVSYGYTG
jgi:hypothetical protein